MAHVEQNADKKRRQTASSSKRKLGTIDMTALVDVAFLLLTFFVLTSTMGSHSLLELTMPPKSEGEQDTHLPVREEKVLTLILSENNRIDYYLGISHPETGSATYDASSPSSLRRLIQSHIQGKGVLPLCPKGSKEVSGCWDPLFVVKAKDQATYKNLVDVLDEFAICGARKYAIDQYTARDSLVLMSQK